MSHVELTEEQEKAALQVLDGIKMSGDINTDDTTIAANIAHSIRLGFPQVKPQNTQADRVCLVGSGPSLNDTFDELRQLYFEGAKIVTVNGSLEWCLARNLRPSAHIVLDARPSNSRFVKTIVPNCRYFIASQCAPETWAELAGRPDVWIWHAAGPDTVHQTVLKDYYGDAWHGIGGGTTVVTRALSLLRTLGWLRFDLFGVDSCWLGAEHHAFEQPENMADRRIAFDVTPTGHPELKKTFWCSTWHVQQLEDFLQMVRINGHHWLLNVHGEGLLAYAIQSAYEVSRSDNAAPAAEGE